MKLKEFDIEYIKTIVLESNSFSEVLRKLELSKSGAMVKYLKEYLIELNISIEDFGKNNVKTIRTIDNIFIQNSNVDQKTLRKWYFKGKYTDYKCSICGQEPVWQEKPLTLILDHINGCNSDDRIENLRWVCPNCNQQLDTTGYRNKK